jgi:hypothetical protein
MCTRVQWSAATPAKMCTRVFFLLLGFLLPAATGSARTWMIQADGGGDAPTIQAGIDSAAVGDTVLVGPGRFYENLDFLGKAIVVKGSGPSLSTIDGGGLEKPCVQFKSSEGRESILEGFRITHGRGYLKGVTYGGGAYIHDAEPTLRWNHIVDNSTLPDGHGGGIWGDGTGSVYAPLIEANVIEENAAGLNGGGIAFASKMAPVIRDNVIEGNTTDRGDGAGIWLFITASGARMYRNRIEGNRAGDHAGGILLSSQGVDGVQVDIYENVIVGNWADFFGIPPAGGGMLLASAAAHVHHNTIVANGISNGQGGGIAFFRAADMLFERNIVALTQAGGGLHCEDSEVPVVQDNLAWQNVGGDGVGDCADWWTANGNLIADPQFCNPAAGDYALAEGSPALTQPAGPLGAYPTPGCPPVPITPTTWGRIKSLYE